MGERCEARWRRGERSGDKGRGVERREIEETGGDGREGASREAHVQLDPDAAELQLIPHHDQIATSDASRMLPCMWLVRAQAPSPR